MIRINFDETYKLQEVAEDLSFMTFYTPLKSGKSVLLKVKISPLEDPLLPDVFNLCFGPLDESGELDDEAKLGHTDANKVFSTILLFCFIYLQRSRSKKIGIDGSNDVRAYLYHRMFLTNKTYLQDFFVTVGVDWYVKLLRSGIVEMDNRGLPYFKPKSEPFDYQKSTQDLYRYYMFSLL